MRECLQSIKLIFKSINEDTLRVTYKLVLELLLMLILYELHVSSRFCSVSCAMINSYFFLTTYYKTLF